MKLNTTSKKPIKKKKKKKQASKKNKTNFQSFQSLTLPPLLLPPPFLPDPASSSIFPFFLSTSRSSAIAKKGIHRDPSWQINPRHRSVMHSISWNRSGGRSRAGPSQAEPSRAEQSRAARVCVGNSADALCIYCFTYLVGNYFCQRNDFQPPRPILGMR